MVKKLTTTKKFQRTAVEDLEECYRNLKQAETLRISGSYDKAEMICRKLLVQHPDYYGALHTLGLVYADRGKHESAVEMLVRASIQHPRSWMTLTALAGSYLQLDAEDLASQMLERAVALNPNNPDVQMTLGEVYSKLRDYEAMLSSFQAAYGLDPERSEAALGIARANIELGNHNAALNSLSTLMDQNKISIQLLSLLTMLPRSFIPDNIHKLISEIQVGPDPLDKCAYLFIQAKAKARSKDFEQSWKFAVEANASKLELLGKANLKKSMETYEQRLNWLIENPNAGKKEADLGNEKFSTLFILGPSRSGKTTAEKLIGSHPDVLCGYENSTIIKAVKQTFMDAGLLSWHQMANLPYKLRKLVANNYRDMLNFDETKHAVLTNTSPGLIWDALFIGEFLPNTKFIFITRNADDLALEIFMKDYKDGHEYSYSILETYKFIEIYHRMIELICSRIPSRTLIVKYEDLVSDTVSCYKEMVQFAGLEMVQVNLNKIGSNVGVSEPYLANMNMARSFGQC